MTSLSAKADYVRSQPQTRDHHCHWPGCTKQVPPAMWGCTKHWLKLPFRIRNAIWRAFEPKQEIDMNPSAGYLAAARAAQEWIVANHGSQKKLL